jgi:hypothetical protein
VPGYCKETNPIALRTNWAHHTKEPAEYTIVAAADSTKSTISQQVSPEPNCDSLAPYIRHPLNLENRQDKPVQICQAQSRGQDAAYAKLVFTSTTSILTPHIHTDTPRQNTVTKTKPSNTNEAHTQSYTGCGMPRQQQHTQHVSTQHILNNAPKAITAQLAAPC